MFRVQLTIARPGLGSGGANSSRARTLALLACALLCGALSCSKAERRLPPPLPAVPPAPDQAHVAEPAAPPEPALPGPAKKAPTRTGAKARPSNAKETARAAEPVKPAATAAKPAAPPAAPPVAAPVPTPSPVRAPAAKTRVVVPSTAHVRVELPSGLQQDLDDDPRMQPWVDKVIAIADGCHAKARAARGTIEAAVTMHEEARPDVDVRSVPSQLGGLVACATGSLMRTKMPLFTGREGTRYVVRLHFQ